MSGGRPTDYDPAYCERVIAWGRDGKSRTWMAAEIGVHRETLYNWEKQHPEFFDALKRAKALEQQWWEDAGQTGMVGDKFNGQVWGRSMAARFPDDWREKSESNTILNVGEGFAEILALAGGASVFPKKDSDAAH